MQVRLIQIGNSMGVRLPKSLIKQFGLDKGEVEILIEKDGIKIRQAVTTPALETWEMLFKKASKEHVTPDADVFNGLKNEEDDHNWEW